MSQQSEQKHDFLVVPHLVVSNGDEALKFYEQMMNATIICKLFNDDNTKIMHSSFRMQNGATIFLCDDFPEFSGRSCLLPKDCSSPVTLHLQFETDNKAKEYWQSFIKKNENNGIKINMEYGPQFWNENYGKFEDKYQHSWSIGSPLNEKPNEDTNKEKIVQTSSKKRSSMDEDTTVLKEKNNENEPNTSEKSCCSDEPSAKRRKTSENTADDENTVDNNKENANKNDNTNGHNHLNDNAQSTI
jgi:uncharacterized glyoxalase superfamily protein PhnB